MESSTHALRALVGRALAQTITDTKIMQARWFHNSIFMKDYSTVL